MWLAVSWSVPLVAGSGLRTRLMAWTGKDEVAATTACPRASALTLPAVPLPAR